MSWKRDPMSWERDKYFFHMSPQCCRINVLKIYVSSESRTKNMINQKIYFIQLSNYGQDTPIPGGVGCTLIFSYIYVGSDHFLGSKF